MKIRNTTLAAIILAAGMMLFIASLAHFFIGYPMIIQAMEGENSGVDLAGTVKTVWVFSSIAMALCGVWGMFIGISIRKNLRYTKKQALSLGSGIFLFGIIGFTTPFPNYQLAIFILIGILFLIPGLLLSKEQGPYH